MNEEGSPYSIGRRCHSGTSSPSRGQCDILLPSGRGVRVLLGFAKTGAGSGQGGLMTWGLRCAEKLLGLAAKRMLKKHPEASVGETGDNLRSPEKRC